MATLNLATGGVIDGVDEVFQSLSIIMTTPKGSRVMRRKAGSDAPDLTDHGMNRQNLIEWYAAIADAVKQEPRFRLKRCRLSEESEVSAGHGIFELDGLVYLRGHLGDYSEAVTAKGTIAVSEAIFR